MLRRSITVFLAVSLLLAAGCSTDTELGGTAVPNARPDTRISGQPPTLLEAGFVVEFNWTGADPDGRIVGYQWKISDNGLDGISPRDTLTIDPLTGAELNPWRFTEATDSTFVVLADQADFPGDPAQDPRSFRTHSIFIRAQDDDGAVDPTPAYMSFTSTTLVPSARAVFPGGLPISSAKTVSTTVNIGWEGEDPDYELRVPAKIRYLWKPASLADGTVIFTPAQYNRYYTELIDFDDPDWSVWQDYEADAELREASFPNTPKGDYYLFALQMQDVAGAVSVGRRYQVEVAHVAVSTGNIAPTVTLAETYLPGTGVGRSEDIASGQALNFSWSATAASYNGKIVSYRHGWDLLSADNDMDPNWSVPPGTTDANMFAEERSFEEGVHNFWLKVVDDSGAAKVLRYQLTVIPYVPYDLQAELLVIDQVVDFNVQNWLDVQGVARNKEFFRNEYWSFLQNQPGGVVGLDWGEDRLDHTSYITYADIVGYKAVLCYAKAGDLQLMMSTFRPDDDVDKYVWLAPYQQRGGNMMLVGAGSLDSFIEVKRKNYMTPFIFTSRDPDWTSGTTAFEVSYPLGRTPDDEEYERGVLAYPYATAGVTLLDWTASQSKYVYALPTDRARFMRKEVCAGLRAVRIDPNFKTHWNVAPGAFPDTIGTDQEIDWRDPFAADGDSLSEGTFRHGEDEFVNANISVRATQWAEQMCEDPNAPGGLCVEPMFRGIARFDWLRELKWREYNDTAWPDSVNGEVLYTENGLEDVCGRAALTGFGDLVRGSSKTNGKTFGFLSYKMTRDKPSGRPDVYWGFDPYRFDHEGTKDAIRWVLKDIFGLRLLDL